MGGRGPMPHLLHLSAISSLLSHGFLTKDHLDVRLPEAARLCEASYFQGYYTVYISAATIGFPWIFCCKWIVLPKEIHPEIEDRYQIMAMFKRSHHFQTIILGIHVSFRGCM